MATISPDYQQKGVPNPYYIMDAGTISATKAALKKNGIDVSGKEILFKAVPPLK